MESQKHQGRKKLEKDQSTYCGQKGHWGNECPNQKGKKGAFPFTGRELARTDRAGAPFYPTVLSGGQDNIKDGGKSVNFLVDTGAVNSVLTGPLQLGTTRKIPLCPLTTSLVVNLG